MFDNVPTSLEFGCLIQMSTVHMMMFGTNPLICSLLLMDLRGGFIILQTSTIPVTISN